MDSNEKFVEQLLEQLMNPSLTEAEIKQIEVKLAVLRKQQQR